MFTQILQIHSESLMLSRNLESLPLGHSADCLHVSIMPVRGYS